MERRLKFCRTSSGQRVPYVMCGRGPALVVDYGWLSHVETAWEMTAFENFMARLGRHRTLVLYDKPGYGLAADTPATPSLESAVAAFSAVVESAGLERFDLFGAMTGGTVAIAYTAMNAKRVNRLALYGTYACGDEISTSAVRASISSLIRAHWGVGSKVLADIWMPEANSAEALEFARFQRSTCSAERAAEAFETCYVLDVRRQAESIRTPTLVLHKTGDRAIRVDLGRDLAERIPSARLVELDGKSHLFASGDFEPLLRHLLEFLGVRPSDAAAGAPARLTRREREVADLIASGLSNAEIASRLAISERTAEAHVEHIRGKLGFRSRAQIAAWVARA